MDTLSTGKHLGESNNEKEEKYYNSVNIMNPSYHYSKPPNMSTMFYLSQYYQMVNEDEAEGEKEKKITYLKTLEERIEMVRQNEAKKEEEKIQLMGEKFQKIEKNRVNMVVSR